MVEYPRIYLRLSSAGVIPSGAIALALEAAEVSLQVLLICLAEALSMIVSGLIIESHGYWRICTLGRPSASQHWCLISSSQRFSYGGNRDNIE